MDILNKIPVSIKIMAVTKNRSLAEIEQVIALGIKIIGENRVQEAEKKFPFLKTRIEKHLIGHLQTNKTKKAVELFDCIESVDSEKIAEEIDKECAKIGKKMPVYIQVNISDEPQKSGIAEKDLEKLIKTIKTLPSIALTGLMTIAENTDNKDKLRSQFAKMRKLKNKYKLQELSMGMSEDWEEAVKFGTTQVRLGRILFTKVQGSKTLLVPLR
ncbi:MAG: alanine racemase domain protein [Candidatus Peregrinibacteria bacterium GW2011_GWF2_43_17]|nr:MAG: alanine racemase domain protein [Candidatus Peregrinibacteria bacterium GW2011_GWF2_43_17]KKT19983.1 MAG: Alanine racemase domain protein [Candidatus Peregrinibacteria bacterium GW2011_GWA2_43_8]HAU39649.1 YggS family pyridoxal phosphate-dependent enzyme [Candidatus Peregrinibacteria bacterium]